MTSARGIPGSFRAGALLKPVADRFFCHFRQGDDTAEIKVNHLVVDEARMVQGPHAGNGFLHLLRVGTEAIQKLDLPRLPTAVLHLPPIHQRTISETFEKVILRQQSGRQIRRLDGPDRLRVRDVDDRLGRASRGVVVGIAGVLMSVFSQERGQTPCTTRIGDRDSSPTPGQEWDAR